MKNIFDLDKVIKAVDGLFTSDEERLNAKNVLTKIQTGLSEKQIDLDLEIVKGVNQVNLQDAKSNNVFQSGWRPFIGWICGIALAYHFVLQPILIAIMEYQGLPTDGLKSDLTELYPLILGMLGMGGIRSFDKLKK